MRRIDYSTKFFKNPAVRKKNKKKIKYYLLFFIIFIIFLINYTVFFSSFLKIKNVKINGNIDNSNSILSLFTNKNILFLNIESIKNNLLGSLPIEEINIEKNYPDTISINIKEVQPELIWITKNKGYFIDSYGKAYSDVSGNTIETSNLENYNILRHKFIYNNIPIVYDKNNSLISLNKIFLTTEYISFIKKVYEDLNKKLNLNIIYYGISMNEYTLEATTSENWKIYFSFQDSVDKQLERLALVLKNQKGDGIDKIVNYIDLRYGDKVFYK